MEGARGGERRWKRGKDDLRDNDLMVVSNDRDRDLERQAIFSKVGKKAP